MVTILDTEVPSTLTVSHLPNDRGWKLVEIQIEDDLESATATMRFSGRRKSASPL